MVEPVVYYVNESDTEGRIVAIAPVALRPDDRLPGWEEMRISEHEWRMFSEGKEVDTNWYVVLDPVEQIHRLQSKTKRIAFGLKNLVPICEARPGVEDPDIQVNVVEGIVYMSIAKANLYGCGGKADFWMTAEQNPLIIHAHAQVPLGLPGEFELFPDRSEPTTIYTNSRFQRIEYVRY